MIPGQWREIWAASHRRSAEIALRTGTNEKVAALFLKRAGSVGMTAGAITDRGGGTPLALATGATSVEHDEEA